MNVKQKRYNDRFVMRVKTDLVSDSIRLNFELIDNKTSNVVLKTTRLNTSYHKYWYSSKKFISYETKRFENRCEEQVKQIELLENSFKDWTD
jgi:hypothetical protein